MRLPLRRRPASPPPPLPVNGPFVRNDDQRPAGRDARTRRRWIAAGGAAAVSIPAGPGLAWAIEGKPGAGMLIILAAAVAIGTGILSTIAIMYEARQETRRKEIECRASDALAEALARCIDDAHIRASNLSGKEIRETARVRASARHLLADVVPSVADSLQPHPGQDSP
jgi:hypothetical protein